jgi:hypothetical protein
VGGVPWLSRPTASITVSGAVRTTSVLGPFASSWRINAMWSGLANFQNLIGLYVMKLLHLPAGPMNLD